MRLPTTELTLPNSINDIKFPVNRIADNTTFNSKIKLIDENFNKLLEYCIVVDNNSPDVYESVWSFDDLNSYSLSALPSPSPHEYNFVEIVEKYDGNKLLICAKDDSIDFYTTSTTEQTNLTLNQSYEQVKDRGSLKFKKISYIKYYNEKLYVYDSGYENIYVYNLISFLSGDTAISSIKFLKQFFRIKGLISFTLSTNIYGITSTQLIEYNGDFNVKNKYTLEKENPKDIILLNNRLYILYQDGIHIYSTGGVKQSQFELETLDSDTFLTIVLSKYNDNIIYVTSNKYIYKYDNEGSFIGYFNISTMGSNEFIDIAVIEDDEKDTVIALDTNKLHLFGERLKTDILYDEINLLDRENITELQISNLELEQDYVYNNILQKAIFNVFLLYNSLIYKPYIETDVNGVLTYKYKENLIVNEVLEKRNIFYGQNEVFSYQTFNRAFEEIYNIQEKIIDLITFEAVENTTNTLII